MMNKMMRKRRRKNKNMKIKMIFNRSIWMNVNLFTVGARVNALILL